MKFRCNTAGEQTTPTDFKRLWKPVFKHQILNVVILPETQFWIIDWFGALAINVPWKYWIWKLCLSFAKKTLKSDKFASWFSFNTNNYDKTRSEKDILTLVKTRSPLSLTWQQFWMITWRARIDRKNRKHNVKHASFKCNPWIIGVRAVCPISDNPHIAVSRLVTASHNVH